MDCKGFSALAAVEVAAACRFWGLAWMMMMHMMIRRRGEFRVQRV